MTPLRREASVETDNPDMSISAAAVLVVVIVTQPAFGFLCQETLDELQGGDMHAMGAVVVWGLLLRPALAISGMTFVVLACLSRGFPRIVRAAALAAGLADFAVYFAMVTWAL